jgi:hypothetical protein
MSKASLKWSAAPNGKFAPVNWTADHNGDRYLISKEPFPIGGYFFSLALNGERLGGSGLLETTKQMAQRRADTGQL